MQPIGARIWYQKNLVADRYDTQSIYLFYSRKLNLDQECWFNNFSKNIYLFICIDSSLCFDFISIHHGQWLMGQMKKLMGPNKIDLHTSKTHRFCCGCVPCDSTCYGSTLGHTSSEWTYFPIFSVQTRQNWNSDLNGCSNLKFGVPLPQRVRMQNPTKRP